MISKEILNRSFWALPLGEVLDVLETTTLGLTQEEAQSRMSLFGKNQLPEKRKITKLKIFLRQFKNPLIIILLTAGAVTLAIRDFNDAIFILGAALANSLLGFYQENKAEEALAHLKTYIEERVRVFRDNHEIEIDTAELVPGDIIHLSQGDRIPADARVIYANDLQIDQAILTGESLPVPKSTGPVGFQAVLAEQNSMIFSGTAVVQGFANAVVTKTGVATEIGKIALLVRAAEREKTPLQEAMGRFSIRVGVFVLVLTAVIFGLGIFNGKSIVEMFLLAVAIAVSAIPEGLPVVLTVILAIGVQRLAHKKGIVRKLLAAETLGSTSVILTDKTGTLTEAKMNLSKISVFYPVRGREGSQRASASNGVDHRDDEKEVKDKILRLAMLNSDVVIENPKDFPELWEIIGRPLEVAAVQAAAKHGILLPALKKETNIANFLPFNSANKFSAAVIKDKDSNYTLSLFGAPEILLKFTGLSSSEKQAILREIDKMAYSGDRVLAVATKELHEPISLMEKKNFHGADFLGTISFRDPVRSEVKDSIERVNSAGVNVVIVTGDHKGTASAVAKEIGFHVEDKNVIDGAELDALTDIELKNKLPHLKIVSRVSPEGKLKILKAFQEEGAVAAMTGDGINDAPTLKEADIGIGMGSGSDVAKDVADLVLLDDNFETIVAAINEGRRILDNIRKAIVYLLSTVLDEVILIGGALLMGVAIPLNPLQILWVNFFTDSFPGVALAFEDGHDRLKQKPRKLPKNLLDPEMKFLVMGIGFLTSFLLLGLYRALLSLGFDQELVRTFIFAVFGTYSLFLIFAVRSLRRSIFTINPFSNGYLLLSVLLGLGLMAIAVYMPFFQRLLGTVFLPFGWLWGVFGIGFLNILLIEFGKWLYRKKEE